MSKRPTPRPQEGDLIWVSDMWRELVHICTVVDLFSEMLRASYEVAREDGGWVERSVYVFYRDCEWDTREQRWVGKAG